MKKEVQACVLGVMLLGLTGYWICMHRCCAVKNHFFTEEIIGLRKKWIVKAILTGSKVMIQKMDIIVSQMDGLAFLTVM